MNYEVIKFENGNVELEVNVSPEEETVWLTQEQIAQLFDRDRSVVSKHIKNVFSEKELDEKSNVHFCSMQFLINLFLFIVWTLLFQLDIELNPKTA